MFSGLLNEVIEIYSYTTQKNSFGEVIPVSSLKYTCRAKVSHLSGSRTKINDEIQYPYSKTFVIRYHVPITEDDKIKYDNKYYIIQSIDKDKAMQQQIIICNEENE